MKDIIFFRATIRSHVVQNEHFATSIMIHFIIDYLGY